MTGYLALPLKVSHVFVFPSCMLARGNLRSDNMSCQQISQHYAALCILNSLKLQFHNADTFKMLIGIYKCFLQKLTPKKGGRERHMHNFINFTVFTAFH